MSKLMLRTLIVTALVLAAIAIVIGGTFAWYVRNSTSTTQEAEFAAAEASKLDITIPPLPDEFPEYMGQTGIEYNGEDSPYYLEYSPVVITANMADNNEKTQYLTCRFVEGISYIDVVSQMQDDVYLDKDALYSNFSMYLVEIETTVCVNCGGDGHLNAADPGFEEGSTEENADCPLCLGKGYTETELATYKVENGYLRNQATYELLKIRDDQHITCKLYMYFIGQEAYDILMSTRQNIDSTYKFDYCEASFMFATFNLYTKFAYDELMELELVPYTANFELGIPDYEYVGSTKFAADYGELKTYSSASRYEVGDFCVYNKILYQCTADINSGESFSLSHWRSVRVSAYDTMATYSTSVSYNIGDLTRYNNKIYSCIDYVTSGAALDSSKWVEISTVPYSEKISYSIGEYCSYNGLLYRCTATVNQQPFNAASWTLVSAEAYHYGDYCGNSMYVLTSATYGGSAYNAASWTAATSIAITGSSIYNFPTPELVNGEQSDYRYTFDRWVMVGNSGGEYTYAGYSDDSFISRPITTKTTLYAQWQSSSEVRTSLNYGATTFNTMYLRRGYVLSSYSDGVFYMQDELGNFYTQTISVPVRAGYVFMGWASADDAVCDPVTARIDKPFPFGTEVSTGTTLYAVWAQLVNITFIADETWGNNYANVIATMKSNGVNVTLTNGRYTATVLKGCPYSSLLSTYTATGVATYTADSTTKALTIKGWKYLDTATQNYVTITGASSGTVTTELVLYPEWNERGLYTVNLDLYYSSSFGANYTFDGQLVIPANVVLDNYLVVSAGTYHTDVSMTVPEGYSLSFINTEPTRYDASSLARTFSFKYWTLTDNNHNTAPISWDPPEYNMNTIITASITIYAKFASGLSN